MEFLLIILQAKYNGSGSDRNVLSKYVIGDKVVPQIKGTELWIQYTNVHKPGRGKCTQNKVDDGTQAINMDKNDTSVLTQNKVGNFYNKKSMLLVFNAEKQNNAQKIINLHINKLSLW